MKTVSFQGARLTEGQRRQLEFRRKSRTAFINPILADQIDKTILAVEKHKERGAPPEKIWFLDYQKQGTPSVAEWMGF